MWFPYQCGNYNAASLLHASSTSARWPKAEKRTNDCPEGPKPAPGVVTTRHFSRISANTSQLSRPEKCAQMYGELSPPTQEIPSFCNAPRIKAAFPR